MPSKFWCFVIKNLNFSILRHWWVKNFKFSENNFNICFDKNIFQGRDGLLKSKTSCKSCFSEYLKALGFSILEGISLFLRIGCFLGLFKNFKRLKDSEKIIFKITKNHFLTNLSLCYLQLHDSVLRSGRLQLRTSGRDDNAPSCGK